MIRLILKRYFSSLQPRLIHGYGTARGIYAEKYAEFGELLMLTGILHGDTAFLPPDIFWHTRKASFYLAAA